MAAEVQIVDGLNVAPRVSPHRQTTLRITDFFELADERRIRVGISRHKKDDYYSPRHRHNFDQVRFTIEGQVKYGPITTQAGDCLYFPEGVFYGPTEIHSDEALTMTIQTQGPSWSYFPHRPDLERATAEVAEKAELDRERGRFRWPDGKYQDSYEAAWEHLTGEKLVYPPARHQHPCLLRSASFEWVPSPRAPGVSVKALARFNESGPAVNLTRLEAGSELPGGESHCHQVATVVSGVAHYGDADAPRGTMLYYPPGCGHDALTAAEECVLLVIQFQPKAQPALAAWVA
jgi:uncharacterized RmlC-like cupin family protein